MLARETDLIPLVRAALCRGGTKDKAAFLEERPLLPDCCLWGKLGPFYCGDDHELCVVCGVNMHSEDGEVSCASAGAQGRASRVPADMKCKSSRSSFSGNVPSSVHLNIPSSKQVSAAENIRALMKSI
ncbi:uncharacterized protein ACIBXB_002842 isoform 1-T1 [Morphnus guianensis]